MKTNRRIHTSVASSSTGKTLAEAEVMAKDTSSAKSRRIVLAVGNYLRIVHAGSCRHIQSFARRASNARRSASWAIQAIRVWAGCLASAAHKNFRRASQTLSGVAVNASRVCDWAILTESSCCILSYELSCSHHHCLTSDLIFAIYATFSTL